MTKHVEIRQPGRAVAVPQGVTILEAALADGIAYPHGCRSGRCGSCKSRLVNGEVDLLDHSRFALSDEEKAQGLILACRAIPTTDAIVAWLGDDEETLSHPRRRLNCRVAEIAGAPPRLFNGRRAGPPPMAEAAMQICTARGLRSEDMMQADVFFTPAKASARTPGFSSSIRLIPLGGEEDEYRSSGQALRCLGEDDSLLRADWLDPESHSF